MKWEKGIPKKTGFYFMRTDGLEIEMSFVEIFPNGDEAAVSVIGTGEDYYSYGEEAEFQGPIVPVTD